VSAWWWLDPVDERRAGGAGHENRPGDERDNEEIPEKASVVHLRAFLSVARVSGRRA
jgi:hypothetical protein